jgi:DNA-directed RNA polymerase sigma subunit (sigma70/sigma32)
MLGLLPPPRLKAVASVNPLTIPTPSAVGSIEQYIATVKSFPVLSAEEELDLATRLQRDNDLEAAKKLILSHQQQLILISNFSLTFKKRFS